MRRTKSQWSQNKRGLQARIQLGMLPKPHHVPIEGRVWIEIEEKEFCVA